LATYLVGSLISPTVLLEEARARQGKAQDAIK